MSIERYLATIGTSPMQDYLIFTDHWWNAFLHEYAFTLLILWALLKCLAMLDPTNHSDEILDSFRAMLSGGAASRNRRITDAKVEDDRRATDAKVEQDLRTSDAIQLVKEDKK